MATGDAHLPFLEAVQPTFGARRLPFPNRHEIPPLVENGLHCLAVNSITCITTPQKPYMFNPRLWARPPNLPSVRPALPHPPNPHFVRPSTTPSLSAGFCDFYNHSSFQRPSFIHPQEASQAGRLDGALPTASQLSTAERKGGSAQGKVERPAQSFGWRSNRPSFIHPQRASHAGWRFATSLSSYFTLHVQACCSVAETGSSCGKRTRDPSKWLLRRAVRCRSSGGGGVKLKDSPKAEKGQSKPEAQTQADNKSKSKTQAGGQRKDQ